MSDSQPLFVRLSSPAAERLNRIAQANGASKREIVTRLILADDMTVGQHDFHPNPEPSVLTVTQAAELLQVDDEMVVKLAEGGGLPGRRLGEQWRFSRSAVLEWLAADQDADQAE